MPFGVNIMRSQVLYRAAQTQSDGLFWVQTQTAAVESAMGPTFDKILIMPEWGQQCWHLADWRLVTKPVTQHCHVSGQHPARSRQNLGIPVFTLHQDTTQPLSTRPTLLMSNCVLKCPTRMLQLRRACRSLDAHTL